VPDDGAEPGEAEIDALVAAFARRMLRPRLEYIAAAAPSVEPALVAAGFEAEQRLPIMICRHVGSIEIAVDGIRFAVATDDGEIIQAAEVGASAYGNDAPYPEPLRRLVAQGGVLAVAHDCASPAIVGAGMATPHHDGVTEIAGIGVLAAFRGREIAGALTSLLTREAFARGASLAWLTPGSDDARNVYARAGFSCVSEQLHISKNAALRGSLC
jgi:ribosomal protein S18 acetylase RimI-like enzyme